MRKLLLVLALLVACGEEDKLAATQVTLTIQANDDLRLQLDDLRATLFVNDNGSWSRRSSVDVPAARLKWPLDVPILARPEDESSQIEVIVEAFAKEQRLAQSRVVTRFVKDRVVLVSTNLYVCPGKSACADDACHGETCSVCASGGACVSVGIANAGVTPEQDASTAPEDAASSNDAGTTTNDAATDAAQPTSCPAHACPDPYVCITTPAGYTCRGQFADWPMPDKVAGAKVAPSYDKTSSIVTDNVTKLQWQVGVPRIYPGCSEYVMYTNGTKGDIGEYCTRQQAEDYCKTVTNGNNMDWRLPTIIELISLYDLTAQGGNSFAVDRSAFGDFDNGVFVTASPYAGSPGQIWAVNYYARANDYYPNNYGKVRCVRGGAVPTFATPADRYTIAGNSVTDQATGLIWQRYPKAEKFAPEANDKGLALVGTACTDGWRVPTIKELYTLVDFTRSSPAINPDVFPNTQNYNYWGVVTETEGAIDFTSGALDTYEDDGYVRCVQ